MRRPTDDRPKPLRCRQPNQSGPAAPPRADAFGMPRLVAPSAIVQRSFCSAVIEYHREDRFLHLDEHTLQNPDEFECYLLSLHERSFPSPARPDYQVEETCFWWVEDNEYLGRVIIRHRLTELFARIVGHIGYDVRPSARRSGHATAMLEAALPLAAVLGLDPVLVTCDVTNEASRRVIERNGGLTGGEIEDTLRFWVPTTRAPSPLPG